MRSKEFITVDEVALSMDKFYPRSEKEIADLQDVLTDLDNWKFEGPHLILKSEHNYKHYFNRQQIETLIDFLQNKQDLLIDFEYDDNDEATLVTFQTGANKELISENAVELFKKRIISERASKERIERLALFAKYHKGELTAEEYCRKLKENETQKD